KSTLLFSFCLLLSNFGFARKAANVTGNVMDVNQKPVEFATVVLLSQTDSSLVKGVFTDEKGTYSFEEIPAGNYLVMVSQMGYENQYSGSIKVEETSQTYSVPSVEMKEKAVLLKEANVTALKPFIERKVDKTVVNVENSIVSAGSTALEILKRSPGVIVDNDGNISIKGKQGVQVLIDGKPTYLSTSDLYNMLRNMSSDQLSTIEIITNPSARYDAAGNSGILNIRLRKKQNLGLNGSVTLSYGQGVYPDFSAGFNLNYRREKFNAYGGYSFTKGFYFERTDIDRRFRENGYTSLFRQNNFDKGHYDTHDFRGGFDYFIDKKQTIGILIKGFYNTNTDNTTSQTNILNNTDVPDSGYVTLNNSIGTWNSLTGNLNYSNQLDTSGQELNVDLDFARYTNRADYKFSTSHYYPNTLYTYTELATNRQPATIDVQSFKVDYVKPLHKTMKLEAGLKTSNVQTDNDVKYYNYDDVMPVLDTGKTNHFNYTERINAGYLSWTGEFNKVGLQFGIRAEQTISKGDQITTNSVFKRNYLEWFPSAFFTYKFSEKYDVKLSYSRRIDRPAYQQLNPFKYFIDPYNFMQGNPFLQPQLTNSFEFAQTFLKLFTLSVNYSKTEDVMTQITKQIDSTRTTFITTENVRSSDNFGVGLSVPVQITPWWYSSNNVNVFNNEISGTTSAGIITKKITAYSLNSYNSFKLPKGWAMELSGYYNSEMIWGTWLVSPQGSLSAGFRKSLFKDRMTLRVNVNDIFHTDVITSEIKYMNVDASFYRIYDSQFVRFHLSYNFGKRTVARSRQRSMGAQDELNRVRTGH
ncbi:MAG TPA: TonB-dependent receptor, partial [Bacteroidia bacterium]|nr:TonB-dependent receptor [Bacteroidia bacterium]